MFEAKVYFSGGKIKSKGVLLINQKLIFQGKGLLQLGERVSLGYKLGGAPSLPILFQPRNPESIISIGKGTTIVNGSEFIAHEKILIGENCLIGARCIILDSDFHGIKVNERKNSGYTKPVFIGNNVWIGINVIILKGVTIGDDVVIGAGSVVAKDIQSGSIAVGNPINIIGSVYKKMKCL